MSALPLTWFILVNVLLVGYIVLDGFDLGIGLWHFLLRTDAERRNAIETIAPFWDGNEVWLLAVGAVVFAVFPPVYATVLSSMYPLLMVLLLMLIVRAVAIQYVSTESSAHARASWDTMFGMSSTLAILLIGLVLGNLLHGLALNATGDYIGTFAGLFNPFALLVMALTFAMLVTHGAIYLTMKAGDAIATLARRWVRGAWSLYVLLLLIVGVNVMVTKPQFMRNYHELPVLWLVPMAGLLAVLLIAAVHANGKPGWTFALSTCGIVLLFASAALALCPTLIPAYGRPERDITITNAAASPLTLQVMLIVVLVGMAIVCAYTLWNYRIFGGRVK